MFGMRFLWKLFSLALLWLGASLLLQGCTVTSTQQPGVFLCKTDFDCLADQICQQGKCINQVNRPIFDSGPTPLPDTPTPPDSGPIDTVIQPDGPGPIDTSPVDVSPPVDEPVAPDLPRVCGPGTRAPCYQGPRGTGGIGACKRGTTTCNDEGQWGPCVGQVVPTDEVCDDSVDNDCDGQVDEECNECPAGAVRTCYTGPPNTRSVGECLNGSQRCVDGKWGTCEGEVVPAPETCDNNKDEDCDGRVDEECNTGNCPEGQQRPCYSGLKGCERTPSGGYTCKGECKSGIQVCKGGKWDTCQGDAKDSPERCDGKDNDCDGQIDNNTTDSGQTCTFPGAQGACSAGKSACTNGQIACIQVVKPIAEKCDNMIDDDCDGSTDEGCSSSVVILTSITPSTTPRAQDFDATLSGVGFQAGAVVEISPANQPTPTYSNIVTLGGKVASVTSAQIKIQFRPLSTTLAVGTYQVRVVNPGNVASNSVFLTLTPSTTGNGPTITSLTPNVATVGQSYSGTFTGTGYKTGASIEIRAPIVGQWVDLGLLGSVVSIKLVNATTMTMSFSSTPGSFNGISLKGAHDIRIKNTDGTFSNSVKLTIQ